MIEGNGMSWNVVTAPVHFTSNISLNLVSWWIPLAQYIDSTILLLTMKIFRIWARLGPSIEHSKFNLVNAIMGLLQSKSREQVLRQQLMLGNSIDKPLGVRGSTCTHTCRYIYTHLVDMSFYTGMKSKTQGKTCSGYTI